MHRTLPCKTETDKPEPGNTVHTACWREYDISLLDQSPLPSALRAEQRPGTSPARSTTLCYSRPALLRLKTPPSPTCQSAGRTEEKQLCRAPFLATMEYLRSPAGFL